ncbi:hypothetical protein FB451DRAFT_1454649 [Mycena latifolia]|nr:hypothetical protein FB451DRAFT_1454649 [Mycena latifolia]
MRLLHATETVPNPERSARSPHPYIAYPAPLPSPAFASASSAASAAGTTVTGARGSGDVMLFSARRSRCSV